MGHWVYCFEVKNTRMISEDTQMNHVSCGIDEYLRFLSGDPQKRGHKLFVAQISASTIFSLVFGIKYLL